MATLKDNFGIAFRAVTLHRLRSISTVIGIIVGVASVIVIAAALAGVSRSITSNISSLGSSGLTVRAYTPFDEQLRGRENHLSLDDFAAAKRAVASRAEVSPVLYPFGYFGTLVRSGTISYATRIIATLPNYQDIARSFTQEGRFVSASDVGSRRRVCVLGADVAGRLKIHQALDSYVQIGGDWFRVVGVMEARGDVFGVSQDDFVIIPYSVGESLIGGKREREIVLNVSVSQDGDIPFVQNDLEIALRNKRMREHLDRGSFEVKTAKQLLETVDDIASTIAWALIGIVSISIVVSGVSVMNMMIVSVTERTREIGVAKALGATRRDILSQFLFEALIMCCLGGAAGVLGGLALVVLISLLVPSINVFSVPAWAYVTSTIFSVGVGLLFGVIPALGAANLEPADALRYE